MGCVLTNGLVVVTVGALAEVAVFGAVVGDSVVVSRQPPNHPYFTHDVVGRLDFDVARLVELVELVVVVSSRHPRKVSCWSHNADQEIPTPPSRRLAGRSPGGRCC